MRKNRHAWIYKALYDLEHSSLKKISYKDIEDLLQELLTHLEEYPIKKAANLVNATSLLLEKRVVEFFDRLDTDKELRDELKAEKRKMNEIFRQIDEETGAPSAKKQPRVRKKKLEAKTRDEQANTSIEISVDPHLLKESPPPFIAHERDHSEIHFGDEIPLIDDSLLTTNTSKEDSQKLDKVLSEKDQEQVPMDVLDIVNNASQESAEKLREATFEDPSMLELQSMVNELSVDELGLMNTLQKEDERILSSFRTPPQQKKQERQNEIPAFDINYDLSLTPPTIPIVPSHENIPKAPRQRRVKKNRTLQADFVFDSNEARGLFAWQQEKVPLLQLFRPNIKVHKRFHQYFANNCVLEKSAFNQSPAATQIEPKTLSQEVPSDIDSIERLRQSSQRENTFIADTQSLDFILQENTVNEPISDGQPGAASTPQHSINQDIFGNTTMLPQSPTKPLSQFEVILDLPSQIEKGPIEQNLIAEKISDTPMLEKTKENGDNQDLEQNVEDLKAAQLFQTRIMEQLNQNRDCFFSDITTGLTKLQAAKHLEYLVRFMKERVFKVQQTTYLGQIKISLP